MPHNNYWDKHGRLHDKPVTDADPYPCNNSFLYTGEASLIGVPVDKVAVEDAWEECWVGARQENGKILGYNRNPGGERFPTSSHDEVVGMLMLGRGRHSLYGDLKRQYFQVCNLEGFVPTPWHKLNPFKVVRDLWRLSREKEPRKTTHKYPNIYPLTFRHAPQHTYFYARCAGTTPNLFHTLYFAIASLFTIYKGSNSSKVMMAFKWLKFSDMGERWIERKLGQLFLKKVKVLQECEKYFPADHPIVVRLKEISNGQV